MPFFLSRIKRYFVPSGKNPHTIKFGPFRGLKMNLDLSYQLQIWLGLAERELFSSLNAIGPRARTGVDIGSLNGEYAIYFLSQRDMKHVFACDPLDQFPPSLATSLALNGLSDDPRLRIVQKFVSERTDDKNCTLDSMAADLEGPVAIKIDVDGGEGNVLRGAEKMLNRRDVYWIVETHSADLERECEAVFRSSNLKTRIIDKAWWRFFLPEMRTLMHNRWMAVWSDELEM
jgi:Methyltransferase FkbM domain